MSYKKNDADIAIIGMAASFAGAVNLRDYWSNIIDGAKLVDSIKDSRESVEDEHYQEINCHDSDAALSLSLNIIQASLDDAGSRQQTLDRKSLAIFLSFSGPSSSRLMDSPGASTNPQEMTARIADMLGFISRNIVVNTVSPSSLAAIKAATKELLARNCDVSLAGGIHCSVPHSLLQREGVSSHPGARPFAAPANKSPASEGGGIVVLKRLADAQHDGDRIYAVLKDIAVFEHGLANELAEDNCEDASLALKRAYDESSVEPDTLALIETSVAGLPLINRQEIQLLTRLFGARTGLLPRCALGSVSAMIGDYRPETTGVAGLIKTALALYYKILPPTLGDKLNPAAQIEKTPFYLNAEARGWIHGNSGKPRRAGVYDFGSQGSGVQAIMEEYVGPVAQDAKLPNSRWPTELLCFSGETRAELLSLIAQVQTFIGAHPGEPIAPLAFTLSGQQATTHRLSVLASDLHDLSVKLNLASEKLREKKPGRWQFKNSVYYAEVNPQAIPAQVAFMFPGYGSYYTGMLADLCLHFPAVRDWFDTLDEIFDEAHGLLPSQLLFPPPEVLADERRATPPNLHDQRGGAQGGFTATLALHELLRSLGVRCDVMVGHSNGENAALIASGTIRFRTRREMFELTRRYTAHDDHMASTADIPTGAFLGVSTLGGEFREQLLAASDGHLYLAMDNCPHQVVLFDDENGIEDVQERISRAGGIALRLPLARAYHTPLYESPAEDMRHVYEPLDFGPGHTRIYSCATTQPFPQEPDAIRALALKQWSSKVRFRETVLNLYGEGVRTFIEVGPNSTLSGFVDDTLRGREHLTVASNTQRRPALEQLQRLLAQLYVEGMDLNLDYLFRFRDVRPVALKSSLTKTPGEKQLFDEHSSFEMPDARPLREAVKTPAGNGFYRSQPNPVAVVAAAHSVAAVEKIPGEIEHAHQVSGEPADPSDIRLAILRGHFDLMQQFLTSQERVMISLFKGTAASVCEEASSLADYIEPLTGDAADSAAWPLLGRIVEMDARRLYCERRFDLKDDSFLRDHALGRPALSGDQRLSPLPVMPFTMSMEILAEAACYLSGGEKVVTEIYNLRGHRWLMLERGSLVLGVLAEVQPSQASDAQDVHVQLFDLGATTSGGRKLAFEGTVRLQDEYLAAPSPLPIQPSGGAQAEVSAADFYQQYAFHGPCFQGIKHLRSWDARGIEAELQVTETSKFFRQSQTTVFRIPAGLLDTTGQLVGLWRIEQGISDFAVFPFSAASFRQYGEPPAPGSRITCRSAIRMKDGTTSEAHFDLLDETQRVVARLEGLQLRNYRHRYIPRFFQPHTSDTYFSEPWMQEETGLACRLIDSEVAAFLEESSGIWKRVFAHLVLDEDERKEWYGLPEKGARRAEWLMGRAAAKDAVRQWAMQAHNLELNPTEIAIVANALGQPLVKCPALEKRGVVPCISISHKRGLAVAVAAESMIGIDIEQLDAHQDVEWLRRTFDAEELALIVRQDAKTLLGLWCAREAAAKAVGTGLQGDPRAWRIVKFFPDARVVGVAYEGSLRDVALWYQETTAFAVCLMRQECFASVVRETV